MPVVSAGLCWQAESAIATPASTRARESVLRPAPGRVIARSSFIICVSSSRGSIENESVAAMIGAPRLGAAGDPIDAVEPAEQHRRRIAGIDETVIGPRELLLGHGVHHVGRDED